MRNILKLNQNTLLILLLLAVAVGCKKKDEPTPQDAIESAEDQAQMEGEYATIYSYADDEASKTGSGKTDEFRVRQLPACATVTKDSTAANRTITIDFGTTGCLCQDGRTRKGIIRVVVTGDYRRAVGSRAEITLDNYYVDDLKFTGTKVIENLTATTRKVTVTNATATNSEGTRTWSGERTFERLAGGDTPEHGDDVITITGSGTGTNRKGITFTWKTIQPIKKRGDCERIVSGIKEVSNSNGKVMTINFDPNGGEPCDRIASVTINGRTREITLRH